MNRDNTAGPAPTVLVLVGTDHHPFDRLLHWIESSEVIGGPATLIQHGYTAVPSGASCTYADFLSHADLASQLSRSDLVICHGGPGTIVDCRTAGLMPVVVPRSSQHGEHVDDHQMLYTARMAAAGLIGRATTRPEFDEQVHQALGRKRTDLSSQDAVGVSATVARLESLIDAQLGRTTS